MYMMELSLEVNLKHIHIKNLKKLIYQRNMKQSTLN
jgi:hypothetical protein|nr:MAG TPA: hypothetical protein [Caudoviricetes sp.]